MEDDLIEENMEEDVVVSSGVVDDLPYQYEFDFEFDEWN